MASRLNKSLASWMKRITNENSSGLSPLSSVVVRCDITRLLTAAVGVLLNQVRESGNDQGRAEVAMKTLFFLIAKKKKVRDRSSRRGENVWFVILALACSATKCQQHSLKPMIVHSQAV